VIKRILKSRFVVFLVTYIIKSYIWLLSKTCNIQIDKNSKGYKHIIDRNQAIICFWHGRILMFPRFLSNIEWDYTAVISAHGDGEFVSSLVESYGYETIRGSSRRDSVTAMRGIIKALSSKTTLCITPDGPKGPRFKVKGSISNLAVKYNIPLVPMSFSTNRGKVFSTWDRFLLPYPFSKIKIDIGEPINLDKPDDEIIEKAMLEQMKKLDAELNLKVDY